MGKIQSRKTISRRYNCKSWKSGVAELILYLPKAEPIACVSTVTSEKRSADVSSGQGKELEAEWEKFRAGKQSHEDTIARVGNILGPVKPASWMKVKTTPTYTSTMENKKYKLSLSAMLLKETSYLMFLSKMRA